MQYQPGTSREEHLGDICNREILSCLKMIRIFCIKNHGSKDELCNNCRELLGYVKLRIAVCPFGTEKPICSKCKIHCFNREMRMRIIEVMKYSGPRMLYRHPILALWHLFNSCRKTPKRSRC